MIIKTRKCSIKIILLSKPQLTFRLNNWSSSLELLFPGSWIQSRICVAFSYHVSLISFNLEQFFSFLLSFFEYYRPIILYIASKCIFFFLLFPNSWILVLVLSCVWLFVTPWTVATRLLCPWNSPGKNTGVGCHSLLQGNLPYPRIEPRSPALEGRFFTVRYQASPSSLELMFN